jgi:hypothetical protein
MTPPYRIETGAAEFVCYSLDELDSTIEQLQRELIAEGPTSVVISEAGDARLGDEIGLGLGIDPTFVLIQIAPCDGEYYISAGNADSVGNVEFFGARELIVVDRRHFVPWRVVRGAVREFLEHGRFTKMVRWLDCHGQPAESV